MILSIICMNAYASEKMDDIDATCFIDTYNDDIEEKAKDSGSGEKRLVRSAFVKDIYDHGIAGMVEGCDTVIYMATARKNAAAAIRLKNQKVVVVEPSSCDSRCKISEAGSYTKGSFDVLFSEHASTKYALVMNFPLTISDGAWKRLHPLVEKSKITIVAHEQGSKEASKQIKDLKASIGSRNWQDIPKQAKIQAVGQVLASYSIHSTLP